MAFPGLSDIYDSILSREARTPAPEHAVMHNISSRQDPMADKDGSLVIVFRFESKNKNSEPEKQNHISLRNYNLLYFQNIASIQSKVFHSIT